MALNNLFRNLILKNINLAIDSYYYKTPYLSYRFKSRMRTDKLLHPPSIFGEENYEKLSSQISNGMVRKALRLASHPEESIFPNEYSLDGPPIGRIYAKIPFKFQVEKGKTYLWCSCGYSNTQPFCDNTHRMLWSTALRKKVPKYRPIKYTADETKDVWFCNCKQSKSRPICDGTHKSDEVKTAFKD